MENRNIVEQESCWWVHEGEHSEMQTCTATWMSLEMILMEEAKHKGLHLYCMYKKHPAHINHTKHRLVVRQAQGRSSDGLTIRVSRRWEVLEPIREEWAA